MAIEGRTHKPVIDHSICGSCMICYDACPATVIPEMRQENDTLRGRAYNGYSPPLTSSILVSAKDQHNRKTPACQASCPLNQDVRGYISLIGQHRYREALHLIRADNPLPSLCGYVCHHPCEEACTRGRLDEPLAIRTLKHFITSQYQYDTSKPFPITQSKAKKVVIIGAGPAGLCAAHELVINGFTVEILEAARYPGGMPAQVIPAFRLPQEALQRDISILETTGMVIKTNTCFGKDITLAEIWQSGADAVILAIGAQKSKTLDIEPSNPIYGYWDCLSFLRAYTQQNSINIGDNIAVIGGGNAALDSARTALRLGAKKVAIIYRRKREDMPASGEEIKQAEAEGVTFIYQTIPQQLLIENEKITGLYCLKTEMQSDPSSVPLPITDSGFSLPVDTVITAIGQQTDIRVASIDKPFDITQKQTLAVDKKNHQTNITGVFAAGDAVTGTSSVVDSMAHGRKTAIAVITYLS